MKRLIALLLPLVATLAWADATNTATSQSSGGGTPGAGTVTSVSATSADSSVTVTGSPVTGAGTFDFSVSASNLAPGGHLPCAQLTAFTGDITISGCAATIAAGAVTLAKQANLAGNSFECNNTGSPAAPIACTAAQAKTVLAIAASDVSGLAAGATPSALVGLTAVAGSSSSFTRADGAPALDPSIAPTWTGLHTWSSTEPRHIFVETDQGSNAKNWDFDVNGEIFALRTRTDVDGAGTNAFAATRGTGTALTNIAFGNSTDNPTFSFLGTGTVSTGGNLNASKFTVTGASIPTTGIYLPGTTILGMATNSIERVSIDASGILNAGFGITQAANTAADGLVLADNTVSSSGNQQYSPSLHFLAHGWGTTTPADAIVDWQIYNQPVQGTTNPSANLIFASQVNGGGYATAFTINPNAITSNLAITATQFIPTSASIPATGIYKPGTNIFGIATASTERGFFDANGMFNITNTEPRQTFIQSGAGTDLKNWDFDVASTVLTGRTRTDADGAGKNWLSVTRGATTAISDVSLGNATDNPTYHWLGNGTATFGGAINIGNGSTATVGNVTFTSSNIPSTGFYRPAANTIGMSTASVERASIDANGIFSVGFGITQAANTSVIGFTLADNTVSSSGNQQYSPALDWIAHGWGTTAPADTAVDFKAEVRPVQGATATAKWALSSQIGVGGYTDGLTVDSAGNVNVLGSLGSLTGTAQAFLTGYFNTNGASGFGFAGGATGLAEIKSGGVVTQLWGGTAVTVSGCGSAGTIRGHGTTGTFVVGTGASTCTFVITVNGATGLTSPHGWVANVDDVTAVNHCINSGTIASTTTATVICNFVVATSDLITFDLHPL